MNLDFSHFEYFMEEVKELLSIYECNNSIWKEISSSGKTPCTSLFLK